ncbi:MAG: aldo/keto reductase [Deltaproteobacteria bacterium]|nr:aldo/keto reductase [Deltaproteobacteria bacterium]
MSARNDRELELSRRQLLAGSAAVTLAASLGLSDDAEAKPQKKRIHVPRRVLGKTKRSVPMLLMGQAMSLDPVFDPKLAECLQLGIDYFDAADCYGGGRNELALGSFLKRTKKRNSVFITSKSDKHDPEGFERAVDESLRKLGTNYLDMFYLHGLKDASHLSAKLAGAVDRLKKRGKIRHFGFSCHDHNVAELLTRAASLSWVESVMFRYNFGQYGDRELNKAIEAAAHANIGLIAMKTQRSAASFRGKWVPFTKAGQWNRQQAVLKAVWADTRITAVVSHMDTFGKLRENAAAAADKKGLSRREIEELGRYAAATRALTCDGCDHLCGAQLPAEMRVGETMRYLMYHDVYGQQETARQLYRALPEQARNIEAVDFRQALAACPNAVDIAWHLRRAKQVLG